MKEKKIGICISLLWKILGFVLPLVGLILWYCWDEKYPQRAESIMRGTLAICKVAALIVTIGIIVSVIEGGNWWLLLL